MDTPSCSIKSLPVADHVAAAERAIAINPVNRPAMGLALLVPDAALRPGFLAVLTSKYWRSGKVHLTVAFMDSPSAELRARLLSHMNAWGQWADVKFSETNTDPQVRIVRANDGYWSYLGTDILGVPRNEPTMNLQGFTMNTPESEFHRVVRHETGHTLGCPHEHTRREIVQAIDPQRAIQYFGQTQGWSPQTVMAQVLTPLEEASLIGTAHADTASIMTYQLPGSIMRNGQPVPGGMDINANDQAFIAKVYPLASTPPPPPPSSGSLKEQVDAVIDKWFASHS